MPKVKRLKVPIVDETTGGNGNEHLTYSAIFSLNKKELDKLCVDNNIAINLPKKSKQTMLCISLGISTFGGTRILPFQPKNAEHMLDPQELIEFSALTPGYLVKKSNWTKNLADLPTLEIHQIKGYLKGTNVIDVKEARHYKHTRAYELQEFVHSIKFNKLSDSKIFCAVQGQCLPSQSTSDDDIKIMFCILDKMIGEPYGGYCSCTAGYCQACGHIGAMLFKLSDLIASGATKLPEDCTVTDVPSYWSEPKGAEVSPKTLEDVTIGKPGCQRKSTVRRTEDSYGKLVLGSMTGKTPQKSHILGLKCELYSATADLYLQVPAVKVLSSMKYDTDRIRKGPPSLKHTMLEFDPDIVPSHEITISHKPTPIAFLQISSISNNDFSYPLKVLTIKEQITSYSADEISNIEFMTRGQNNNLEWFLQRMGAVTATKVEKIVRFVCGSTNASVDNLIIEIMGYKYTGITVVPKPRVASLKWGVKHESVARRIYTTIMKNQGHQEIKVIESGLRVHPTHHYIRASPDGIVSCSCHDMRLLEIKCPYAIRDISAASAVQQGKLDYIVKEESTNSYLLHPTKRGYFHQIQTTMAICNLKSCDFMIWTPKGSIVLNIKFDVNQWIDYESKIKTFFAMYIIPEMLTKRLQLEDISNDCCNKDQCTECNCTLSEASISCHCVCGCIDCYCFICIDLDSESIEKIKDKWNCKSCQEKCE